MRLNKKSVKYAVKDIEKVLMDRGDKYGFDAMEKIADILKSLFPDGVHADHYRDFVGLMFVIHKLVRCSELIENGNSKFDTTKDLGGYAVLLYAMGFDERIINELPDTI